MKNLFDLRLLLSINEFKFSKNVLGDLTHWQWPINVYTWYFY